MENSSHFEEEKKTIAHFAGIFLKQEFGFPPKSLKVLVDHDLVVIRVDNFLSPAEIEMGKEKRDTSLIQEMYSNLFNKVNSSLVDRINQITSKKTISSQISINIETKVLIMTFFLFSTLIEKE